MILQSLHKLYDRLSADPAYEIAKPGYSPQKISFRIVIKRNGELFSIQPISDPSTKKPFVNYLVPKHQVRSGTKILPQFLCDKANYCLGVDPKTGDHGKFERQFAAFKEMHLGVESEIGSREYSAFCRFLENWNKDAYESFLAKNPDTFTQCLNFGIFELQGEHCPIHERTEVKEWWDDQEPLEGPLGRCLITGEMLPISRLHPKIKGFGSATALVGIQKNTSYESYGLEQAFTAPTSERAAFKYSAALNWMLDGQGKAAHRFYLADTTCVFWTDRPSIIETAAPFIFGDNPETEKGQDEAIRSKIEVFLKALRQGKQVLTDLGEDPDQTHFYLLGIEQPNPGRFSIRFFHQSNVSEFLGNISNHYEAISIIREFSVATLKRREQPEFPSSKDLINQTAVRLSSGKLDYKTIPPLLGGALMRAILENTKYPEGLYSAVIRRIRADCTINYIRAAILKGILTRNHNQTIPTMLDITIKQPSYLLGRLFAVMEQTQRQAHEFKLERTIRESFFSSASATPASVFPRIHKLHIHHLRKIGQGSQKFFEDLVGEILSKMEKNESGEIRYPKTLTLADQGGYAIGYYQQMVALKTKKEATPESKSTSA